MTGPEKPSYPALVDRSLPENFVGLQMTGGALIGSLSSGRPVDVAKTAPKLTEAWDVFEEIANVSVSE